MCFCCIFTPTFWGEDKIMLTPWISPCMNLAQFFKSHHQPLPGSEVLRTALASLGWCTSHLGFSFQRWPTGNFSDLRTAGSDQVDRLGNFAVYTPLKTKMSPENQWLEDVIPYWNSPFLGDMKNPVGGFKRVVSKIFYFHLYLGKIPNSTNMFQMGWNHQLDEGLWKTQFFWRDYYKLL